MSVEKGDRLSDQFIDCGRCHGTGRERLGHETMECPRCTGSGLERVLTTVELRDLACLKTRVQIERP